MKLQFRGGGGRKHGEIDFLAGLTLAAAVITVSIILVSSGQVGWCRVVPLLSRCSTGAFEDSAPIQVLRTLLTFIAIVLFLVAIFRIFSTFVLSVKISTKNWFSISRLTRAKLIDEIQSFPNTSRESFDEQLDQAKKDESKLRMANDLGLIRNGKIYEHIWPIIQGRLSSHSDIHDVASARNMEYLKVVEQLKQELSNPDGRRVRIFVSAVHPGILYCTEAVRTDAGQEGLITVSANTLTGPTAVKQAYERAVAGSESGEALILIAPLSAYSTFGRSVDDAPINEFFTPVSCLVTEVQDLLVVSESDNLELRKGTLFVYNNSTAEECLARLPPSFVAPSGDLNICLVDSFDDYKMLLRGEINTQGDRLINGDAIITWPPLTQFYEGKAIGASYLARAKYKGETGDRASKIILYVSKEVMEHPEKYGTVWTFIDSLTRRFLLESGRSRTYRFQIWEIFLKILFIRLWTILPLPKRFKRKSDFFSDHESNFRKMVK